MARVKRVIAFFIVTTLVPILLLDLVPFGVTSSAAQEQIDLRSFQWWFEGVGENTTINFPIAVIDSGCSLEVDPTGSLSRNIVGGWNVVNDNSDFRDVDPGFHGTHMAGVIASYVGVAESAPLLIVRAGEHDGRTVRFNPDNTARGIVWAVDHGARVINCSLGGGGLTSAIQNAVDYAQEKGVILVLAAGNDGKDRDVEPDLWSGLRTANIIRVAATLADGNLAPNSAFGLGTVEVGARVEGVLKVGSTPSHFIGAFPGSSTAAAVVSGIAGLLLNTVQPGEVIERIYKTVDRRSELSNKLWTGGIVNPGRALRGEVNAPLDTLSFEGKIKKNGKKLKLSGTEVLLNQQATRPLIRIWVQHSLAGSVAPLQDGSFRFTTKGRFMSGTEVRVQSSLGGEMSWSIP